MGAPPSGSKVVAAAGKKRPGGRPVLKEFTLDGLHFLI